MPINLTPVLVASVATLAVTAMTTPVLPGDAGIGARIRGVGQGTERTRAKKRVTYVINRPGADGQIAIYGANLPDALSGKPLGNAFATPQTETVAVWNLTVAIAIGANQAQAASGLSVAATTADMPALIAAGVPTLLHIVAVNGVLLRCSNAPAVGTATAAPEITFTVTAGVITLYVGAAGAWTGTTPAPVGSEVVEHFVAAPDQILAAGAHLTEFTAGASATVLFMTAPVAVTVGLSVATVSHSVD